MPANSSAYIASFQLTPWASAGVCYTGKNDVRQAPLVAVRAGRAARPQALISSVEGEEGEGGIHEEAGEEHHRVLPV